MRRHYLTVAISCLVLSGLTVGSLLAALTADQKKELKEIQNDIAKIAPMISKKKLIDAENAIGTSEERIRTFIEGAKLKETDSQVKSALMQIEKAKNLLEKASNKGGSTFTKLVAPVLANRCVSCHAEDGKGGLDLSTFEGLEKGGQSGPVINPGSADESLIFRRITIEDEQLRMPKGKDALNEKEVRAIWTWIAEGARFDGDKTASMASLAKSSNAAAKPNAFTRKAEVTKASGNETVHFMADLMPEFMDTCGRCHNDTQKRSGFSVMSFEKIMKGGDSGQVIVPGKPEESRLWRLVNGDETPVMPAGNQTGITRKWHQNLKTWILEGAKFDGDDPKKNFPTLEERDKVALANSTPEEWVERRKKSSESEWKKTFPSAEPIRRETSELLLYGDVSDDRLAQIEKWAGEQIASLRQTFKVKDDRLWRGKLAVFVFKERFGYEEFNSSIHRRDVPVEVLGHSHVTANQLDALIAMQDIPDTASDSSPGMQVNVIEQLTSAFLKRNGSALPDWVTRGTGLAIAHRKSAGNPYLAAMPRAASAILQESKLNEPEKVFANGTFSPSDVGPIGFTLVEFLLKRGDFVQFGQFVQKVQSGTPPETAVSMIYQMEAARLAMAYAESLPMGLKKGKK